MISPYEYISSRQHNAALAHFGDAHPHAVGGATNFSSLALELSLRLSSIFCTVLSAFLTTVSREYVVWKISGQVVCNVKQWRVISIRFLK